MRGRQYKRNYIDAIENTFVRENTARAAPASLAEAFATAGKSLRLYDRLTASQGREKKRDGQERRERGGQRLLLLLGTKEEVAIRAIVGETTPIRGDGESLFLTQDNQGVGSVDSWVTYGGSAPEWGVHQGEGGLLEV